MVELCLRIFAIFAVCCIPALPAAGGEDSDVAKHHWPQWRGPLGTGVAPDANPPVQWSETKNIRWKTALPGLGHSTPIVWRDRIFLTTAVPFGEALDPRYSNAPGAHDNAPVTHRQKFVVLALDRRNGKILWQKTMREQLPHEGTHHTGSLASASPVTDGKHLFAFFGSYGLYCLDFDGQVQWKADLGTMHSKHGGKPQVVVSGTHRTRGYDLAIQLDGAQGDITGRDGTTLVIRHADEPKPLALNRLNDRFNASAAVVGRELFLRGERHLYCIVEE